MQKATQALKRQLIKSKGELIWQDVVKQLSNIKKVLVKKLFADNIVQGFS